MRALTVMQCELQGEYKTQPEDVGRAVNHLGSSLAFFHEELAAEVHQNLYETVMPVEIVLTRRVQQTMLFCCQR